MNDRYIDRNYGGITMLWDRLFGTFVEEDEKCVYGTRAPLDSWDPLWANLEVYVDLARKSRHAERWRDRLAVWHMPPGWQPAVAGGTAWHKPHFDVTSVRRFDPPMSRSTRVFAFLHFGLVLVATTALLWFADELPLPMLAAAAVAVLGVLWVVGAVMQGRLSISRALTFELAGALLLSATDARAPQGLPRHATTRPCRRPWPPPARSSSSERTSTACTSRCWSRNRAGRGCAAASKAKCSPTLRAA